MRIRVVYCKVIELVVFCKLEHGLPIQYYDMVK